jgi:hypothetical protein
MRNRTQLILASIVVGFGLSGTALADAVPDNEKSTDVSVNRAPGDRTGVPGIDADIRRVDTDHDTYISRAEANKDKKLVGQFSTLDTDHDGRLSRNEFETFYANHNPGDNNTRLGDGKIGDPTNDNPNIPGKVDDSVPGNPDELGPGR